MTERRVLVTGAGGFVGQALSLGFADLGWDVIALDRAFDDGSRGRRIRRLCIDLTDGVPAEVPAVDLVVHAAWTTTAPATLGITQDEYIAMNLGPLRAALHFAVRARPAAFVFLSSSGVFAHADGKEGLTDADHPTETAPYAAAKREGEALVPAELDPVTKCHVVRLGYLFGPGEAVRPSREGVSPVARWLAAARNAEPLAVRSDDPRRDWTFTSDLAPALDRIVAGPSAGRPVHLGSAYVLTDRAFATLIASHFSGAEPVSVPAEAQLKPPMVPSDIPALRGFDWTSPASGLRSLLAGKVEA